MKKNNSKLYDFIRYGGVFYIPVLLLTHLYTHGFDNYFSGGLRDFMDWFTSFYSDVMAVFGSMSFSAGVVFILIVCALYTRAVKN